MGLIYKRTKLTYPMILTDKYQELLSKRYFLCLFLSKHSIHIIAPGIVAYFTIHMTCGYITAAGLWFIFELFEVSYSFGFRLKVRPRQRFAGRYIAKYDDQKNELDYIAYSAVIKQERNLSRHDVTK